MGLRGNFWPEQQVRESLRPRAGWGSAERLCWGRRNFSEPRQPLSSLGQHLAGKYQNAVRDTAEISSSARWRRVATGAPASPQLATREHVEKRHQRDETEHGPCQLRA